MVIHLKLLRSTNASRSNGIRIIVQRLKSAATLTLLIKRSVKNVLLTLNNKIDELSTLNIFSYKYLTFQWLNNIKVIIYEDVLYLIYAYYSLHNFKLIAFINTFNINYFSFNHLI